jgi:hypothetical protein
MPGVCQHLPRLAIPALDFAGVAAKLGVFLAGYHTPHDDIIASILDDAERLVSV